MDTTREAIAPLVDALIANRASKGPLLVVTGAGISLASGISTFRGSDPGAIWSRDVTALGTYRYFREDPAGSWHWYLTRFAGLEHARPNAAHQALVSLERWQTAAPADFLLTTQNIDTLHEQAGSRALVKIHGSSDRVRCARPGCVNGEPSGSLALRDADLRAFRADPTERNVPRCPVCNDYLRMHVLWFDEFYGAHHNYEMLRVERAAKRTATLVLFVGTSFSVGITDMIVRAAGFREVPMFNLDPTPRAADRAVHSIALRAEDALPAVCDALGLALSE